MKIAINTSGNKTYIAPALLLALCALLSALWPAVSVEARVAGRCKDCHEMHADEPFPSLATGSCLDCHAMKSAGSQNIISLGRAHIPQVIHNMTGGDLASGNFYYVADTFSSDYEKGHNVAGISTPENPPMSVPPGFMPNIPIPGGAGPVSWPENKQLTCAGTWGCHGNRTIEDPYKAMSGAHHADDRVLDGSTVGRSFRFLLGVTGTEHPEWEYLATPENHNGYRGDRDHVYMDTVSYFCGQCHANFHPSPYLGGFDEAGSANSAWVRHPVDIAFSSMRTPYAGSEYQDFTRYSLDVPVGFDRPTGKESVVDIQSVIICTSCHRAHASPFKDALRWNYTAVEGSDSIQGKGCLTCHTRKGEK